MAQGIFPVFRSTYTLLQSAITIDAMLTYAEQKQIQHVTIADKNVLYGAIEFYQKARARQLVPHIGMQLQLAHLDLLLIAKNNQGLTALQHLSSKINSYDFVFTNEQDLFADVRNLLIVINNYQENLYHQLARFPECDVFLQQNLQLSGGLTLENKPVVHMPIINTLTAEDKQVLQVLYAIEENKELTNIELFPQAIRIDETPQEVPHIFETACVTYDFETYHLPAFSPDTLKNKQLFDVLCKKGLQKRYQHQLTPTHLERLQYEMSVIEEMGFIDYFLIIWDVMRFARAQDILIGPGRGSAVGSLVAYVLGITKIDPLAYDLLFERFLNTSRLTLPDIDIDVEDTRRNEIIQYLREKYGMEYVANILTFGTFGAKSAIRDVAKAYNIDAKRSAAVLKQVTQSTKTIAENLAENPALQKIIDTHDDIAQIIRIAQQIEGYPRHSSLHAAGVILTDTPIENFLATTEPTAGALVTQATMYFCERIGLLKIDFLGLRNLTIIRQVAEKVMTGDSVVQFVENDIPDNDQAAFDLLSSGETTGIFQFESGGMRQVLQRFKIQTFADIAVVLSLYRPGPMQFISEYIARKEGHKTYEIALPLVEPMLKETFGIMVYQEQVMQIAQTVGQMSLAEADNFRRAMSKKNAVLLEQQKERFIAGSKRINQDEQAVNILFDEIMAFASYGFNKSHAIAYGQIAYQMAYLKVHYPAVFMLGLLNNVISNEKKAYQYLQEAMRFGIKILPADINKSEGLYTEENGNIRIGLSAIKGIGKITVSHILEARAEGPFTTIADFLMRTDGKIVNSGALEQLTNGYAFSVFSKNQKAIHRYLEIHETGRKFQTASIKFIDDTIPQDIDDYTLAQRRDIEIEAYGYALFAHPLLHYPKNTTSLKTPPKSYLDYVVYIERVKEITTKKGDKMAFLTISDLKDMIEVVVFPQAYEKYGIFLRPQKVVKMTLILPREQKGNPSVSKVELIPEN